MKVISMREIKFRAWSGTYLHYFSLMEIEGGYVHANTNQSHDFQLKDDTPVMQFTGLKDRQGKEIYEGDIVRSGDATSDIRFGEYQIYHSDMGASGDNTDKEKHVGFYLGTGRWDTSCTWEVIGNQFENPELLKTKSLPDDPFGRS